MAASSELITAERNVAVLLSQVHANQYDPAATATAEGVDVKAAAAPPIVKGPLSRTKVDPSML
jgi:hypothetical protein